MSLPEDLPPPGHVPPAGTAPWPIQPPPHGAAADAIPVKPRRKKAKLGPLGAAVIGGAVAAIGLVVALPWLRRELAPVKPKRRRAAGTRKKKA